MLFGRAISTAVQLERAVGFVRRILAARRVLYGEREALVANSVYAAFQSGQVVVAFARAVRAKVEVDRRAGVVLEVVQHRVAGCLDNAEKRMQNIIN